ncbi:hypothetical protein GCM10009564_11280 [Streptomyces thermogriseus]|uniref:Uncharacterized protein n=1 Tax=Streptomyces thermogriseus TaxID=75292 RepID=A0ABP4DFC8_9ACTN
MDFPPSDSDGAVTVRRPYKPAVARAAASAGRVCARRSRGALPHRRRTGGDGNRELPAAAGGAGPRPAGGQEGVRAAASRRVTSSVRMVRAAPTVVRVSRSAGV